MSPPAPAEPGAPPTGSKSAAPTGPKPAEPATPLREDYSPDQPRAEDGRFGDVPGNDGGGKPKTSRKEAFRARLRSEGGRTRSDKAAAQERHQATVTERKAALAKTGEVLQARAHKALEAQRSAERKELERDQGAEKAETDPEDHASLAKEHKRELAQFDRETKADVRQLGRYVARAVKSAQRELSSSLDSEPDDPSGYDDAHFEAEKSLKADISSEYATESDG